MKVYTIKRRRVGNLELCELCEDTWETSLTELVWPDRLRVCSSCLQKHYYWDEVVEEYKPLLEPLEGI